jgi:RpiB/LacA/LacB family sugar-phosphate isomerase|tara:strand:- start:61 stop:1218 length:1158 start_codon:yes stop_codon:yes gene_type:complete
MKPNILVPMAGLGSRFIKEGFKVPKQLINIKDKHLIDISLDCLDYEGCNLIFVVRDETVYNFHMDDLLRKKFGDDIKVVVLDKLTDGSVCSCLYAEEYIDNDAPLIIHTLDIEFRPVFDPHIMNNLNGDGLLLTFKSNSSNYSYAKVDKNGFVTQTAEKKAISSDACVGIYGFKKGSDFCKYAREMIKRDLRTNNEFYISPLYNLLIEDGKKIRTEDVDKMHVFGTPDEFHFYKDNVTRRLGDKPIAVCSDHSGFEAKETFKKVLEENGYEYIDFGTILNKDCDYRDYISQAVKSINERDCDYGFGFCRTGQGVNICANKYKGIRSALIYDTFSMQMAIRHNCANFFAIPSRGLDYETLDKYLYLCANHTFDGGRHQIRIQELEK